MHRWDNGNLDDQWTTIQIAGWIIMLHTPSSENFLLHGPHCCQMHPNASEYNICVRSKSEPWMVQGQDHCCSCWCWSWCPRPNRPHSRLRPALCDKEGNSEGKRRKAAEGHDPPVCTALLAAESSAGRTSLRAFLYVLFTTWLDFWKYIDACSVQHYTSVSTQCQGDS